jgi:acyl-CoA dehydrogenase
LETQTPQSSHLDVVARIAREVAGPAADSVDREARFPTEAIEALKKARMLSAFVPVDGGGLGSGMIELASMCEVLGQHCSAAAMVFAMHQIQVACLVRHGMNSPTLTKYVAELVEKQPLIASVTSEVGVGGEMRTSICGIERAGGRFTLAKDASTIS